MYALKYFVYLCLFPAFKIHGYRTVKSDYTSLSSHAQVPLPQPNKMVELRVVGTDRENTGKKGDSATLSYESSHEDMALISAALDREVAVREGDSATLSYESSQDDEPIVVSVQTYVCANLAFLATFVALLYCKERYYTRYYGTRWDDDDDSMHEAKRAGGVKWSANPLVLVI